MNDELQKLLTIYRDILDIINSEKTHQTSFLKGEIQNSILMIENALNHNLGKEEIARIMEDLEKDYSRINHPHTGLSDFFIWKENSNERIAANKKLDELKNELKKLI